MASQKTYMIAGVPFVARNKNAVERVVKIDAMIATSDLNQRFNRRMIKNAVATAIIIEGSLIDNKLRPNVLRLNF